MTPKEALIKDGFPGVKAGKGRLSNDAKARCAALASQGWNIDGYAVSSNQNTGAVEVKHTPATSAKVVADGYIRFDRNTHRAFTLDTGVEVTMASACWCGYSLTGHICEDPKVLVGGRDGHVRVRIEGPQAGSDDE